ncbi:minor tail protein [Gordonia phage Verity]|uniref:Minor tail protein n=2 Tax=Zitchvirus TaxID=2948963 RepID=A0A514DIS5_9CAUD|nr:minor tail protein [Gordonia phage Zipp]YP_010002872.1 minor tail protein [Gordonia phage Verity]QPO16877.1 minor tail protein [Gordonia phage Delrey21]QXN74160.1 minor tail protein [Gordonia phage DoctorFroggo]QDH93188.1 minor tail protein [Gordonia phage Zipp]QDH93520.1 minor tail protein [Gordonia phage Verity]
MPATPTQMRAELQASFNDWLAHTRRRPTVLLYDKNWQDNLPVFNETACKVSRRLNDTGEGNLRIFGNDAVYDFVIDELGEWEDLHVRIQFGHNIEWTGKVTKVIDEGDDNGFEFIELKIVHEFEHAKKVVCFANPFFPAQFQWPKIWAYGGPSAFGVTTLLFLNLLRRFALPWTFSDNLFDPASWLANFNPANWPIVVVPKPFFTDTSMWCVLATRFGNFYDVVLPTLKDAGLHLDCYRWFPGMPQPASSHYTLTKPTLVFDVKNKSGYVGPTGTLLDGIATLISEVADDLINEVVTETSYVESPEYSVAGFMGTTRPNPWATFRHARSTYGQGSVESYRAITNKATASSIVTGGKSPDWVNAGVKLLLNAALGYLGMLIGNPALGLGIFEGQVTDVILAFHRIPNPVRVQKMGEWGPPFGEYWESTGSNGMLTSVIQAIRTGFFRSRAYRVFEVKVIPGRPLVPGAHFDIGDRVNVEVGRKGKLHTDYVYDITTEWSRTQDPTDAVTIGDGVVEDTPGAILSRQIASIKDIVQSVGVSA